MNGRMFPPARVMRSVSLMAVLVAFGSVSATAEEEAPVDAAIHYELSDPVDSPPVNYRSGYDAEYDTPDLHNAEMYAEEYERQQREEQLRRQQQLDKINDFTSGARTTKGITGGPDR